MSHDPAITDAIETAVDRAMVRHFEPIKKLINELLVKRPTQKTLAKRAGVHPVTFSRRKKRAALELLANGRR